MSSWQDQLRERLPPQRTAAVGMILVQSVALAVMMNSIVFPACAAVIACAGLFAHRSRWTLSLPGDRWILVLGGVFIAKYSFAPREFPFQLSFLFTDFAYEVASFCIVVQLMFLFRKQNEESLPIAFSGFAIVGLVFTGNIRLNRFRRVAMLVLIQAFLFAWMWFSLRSRREVVETRRRSTLWRTSIMLGVLIVSAVTGITTSILLHRNERTLENLVVAYLAIGDAGPARSGFSNRGGLSDVSNWRHYGGDRVALRIESITSPRYMRGKVFDEFQMNRWSVTSRSMTLMPSPPPSSVDETVLQDNYYFRLDGPIPSKTRSYQVWPIDNETAGHCFAPLDTIGVSCRSNPIAIDRNGILTRIQQKAIAPYTLTVSPQPLERSLDNHESYLQLPSNLDERVLQIADDLFEGTKTTKEKIQVAKVFFRNNFQYEIGIEIPDGDDRLAHFLEHRSAAHCEYFATATAILLRLQEIPTRYVTGFIVQEKNNIDGNWIARRQDAHAWVEAYDAEAGQWVTVESTPSDGIPRPAKTTLWQQRREASAHFLRSMQDLVKRGRITEAFWMFAQPLLWLFVLGGITMSLFYLATLSKIRFTKIEKTESSTGPPDLIRERQLMDKSMTKRGFRREAGETTTQFAKRIEFQSELQEAEQLATWYRNYSRFRFRPGYQTSDVEALRQERQDLQ